MSGKCIHKRCINTTAPRYFASELTGCQHWVTWTPAIFIDSVVARSTVVAQDHWRPCIPRCRC